ncbi:hypothetical protein HYPSUDRAFT_34903 [Hypholoma sublateritium FD-334 SS-4]|uniref:Uncharacterized protein n=1 Tax=Hypholoma sublateritium (strain FD-334 SS-4) TaxID=945553 RepID=A0A0D2LJD9_HYPSF|nr:hypothetical protein HYPSUDRAFT_34903 [Hypholoma sublateritium FD-334 SS-4]
MASRIRRKPQVTYKSPSADDHAYISLSLAQSRGSSPSSSSKVVTSSSSSDKGQQSQDSWTRRKHSAAPSLPLFHPYGRLALSLPPLDPTHYGLPILANPDKIESKPSLRTRRSPTKPREVEKETSPIAASVSAIAAVAAQEVKERASPRKRRAGGAKRKRKDPEDADATYPAKRTRHPRGANGQGVDDDSVADGPQPEEVEPVAEAAPELSDSAKRRSTRGKGSIKRRDSSASETTSISGSANVISGNAAGPTDATSSADADKTPKAEDVAVDPAVDDDDKEEGELSEEQPGKS